ncbi:unnamed protein product [Dicrocoelium dendriticum]|nr:unnamed protein product [Dicrocoelium dendriticum]
MLENEITFVVVVCARDAYSIATPVVGLVELLLFTNVSVVESKSISPLKLRVSFWLLRAEVLFKCPDGFTKPDEYFVHIEQWIETNSWTTATRGSAPFHSSYDQDSSHPIAYNAVPDKIIRLNCSSGKKSIREHIAGYVRRLRVSWKLSGALSPLPSVWTTPSSPGDKKQSKNSTWDLLTYRRPLHPGFGFGLRFTSRMLFEGNLGSDRKRVLCEFFSGFWCNSVQLDVTSKSSSDNYHALVEPDREACVPASMRCDRLPDCDLTLASDDDLVNRSADEAYCNVYRGKYSFGQLDHPLALRRLIAAVS